MTTAVPPHANGHARPVTLAPLRLPERGRVSGWPQDDPGQSRTTANDPERRRHLTAVDGDTAIRMLAAIVVLAVAAFAAIVSYSHIFELGRAHGQDGTAARLLPLSVDGLIASASLVMLHAARRKLDVPPLSRWMLGLGVAATVAANIFYGLPFGWLSAVVSAWPAVAFVGSVEMAVRFVRDARQDSVGGQGKVAAAIADSPDIPADNPGDRTADSQAGGAVDKTRDKPALSRTARGTAARTTKLDKAAAAIRRYPDVDSNAELAKRAGVSAKTVQRARNGIAPKGAS